MGRGSGEGKFWILAIRCLGGVYILEWTRRYTATSNVDPRGMWILPACLVPKISQICLNIIPNRSQHYLKTIPELSQNNPRMMPNVRETRAGVNHEIPGRGSFPPWFHAHPFQTQGGPSRPPKRPSRPQVGPKSAPIDPQGTPRAAQSTPRTSQSNSNGSPERPSRSPVSPQSALGDPPWAKITQIQPLCSETKAA